MFEKKKMKTCLSPAELLYIAAKNDFISHRPVTPSVAVCGRFVWVCCVFVCREREMEGGMDGWMEWVEDYRG